VAALQHDHVISRVDAYLLIKYTAWCVAVVKQISSHRICLLICFKKSTPQQKFHLIIYNY